MASAQIVQQGKALYAYTGSEWIPLNSGVGFTNIVRWHKTAVGGETTLSGNDDNNLALFYTPGLEQVYLNGILLVRGSDYTASTGSTITNLAAISAGNSIDIIAYTSLNIANVYSKNQSDGRYLSASSSFIPLSASSNFEPNIAYVSASPSGPSAGTLWIDSSASATPSLKVYNGSTWIAVSGASEAGLHPFFQVGM
jgi:hypothetical protein